MYIRRNILHVFIVTSLYMYCAYANQGLTRCKEQMVEIFNYAQKPLLECIKHAITHLRLYDEAGNIKQSTIDNYPDVVNYYKTFIDKVSGDKIQQQQAYCEEFTKHLPSADPYTEMITIWCLDELAFFGNSREDILYNALYVHSQQTFDEFVFENFPTSIAPEIWSSLENSRGFFHGPRNPHVDELVHNKFYAWLQKKGQSSFSENQSLSAETKFKHSVIDFPFYYILHIADAIKLLKVNSNDPTTSAGSNPENKMLNPEDYCIDIYT